MPETADPRWVIEKLAKHHERKTFDCGEPSLNDFLKKHAGQYQRRNLARIFVAVAAGQNRVDGYYTLSSGSVRFQELPEDLSRKLPRHPIPIVCLGRLAVNRTLQGQGLGELLLGDALNRTLSLSQELGILAVEVQALNDRARRFYLKYGFTELADDRLHLFLPLSTINKIP